MARWFVDRSAQRGIPSVSLRRLLAEAAFAGVSDLVVSGISADSRRLEPGEVFVALRGRRHDGHEFVARAFEQGASAAVVERACPEAGKLQVVVPDAGVAYARIAEALAGDPSGSVGVIGLTGPRGAEATAGYLLAIFEKAGLRVGWINPSGWSDGVAVYPPRPVEPDAAEVAGMLARMVERRCDLALVCLSPEALDRQVASGLTLRAAVVCDTTPSDAAEASPVRTQARLVRRVAPDGLVAINADDADAAVLAGSNLEARLTSFGMGGQADCRGRLESLGPEGSRLVLDVRGRSVAVRLSLPGSRVGASAMAAVATALGLGFPIDLVVEALESVQHLAGEIEPIVPTSDRPARSAWFYQRFRTVADLGHAVETLRESEYDRLHLIVPIHRAMPPGDLKDLARLAEAAGLQVVATLDPAAGAGSKAEIDAFLARFRRPGRVRVEPDVRSAIRTTSALARPGEAVLLIGSGRRPTNLAYHLPAADCPDVMPLTRPEIGRRSA